MTTEDIFDQLDNSIQSLAGLTQTLGVYLVLLQEKIDDKSDVRQDE